MSGNGWRLSSHSYQVQQTEHFPFVCCWCQQSFMDIEALICHHEAHLMLLQNQVQSYYSTTFVRPQRGGNLSMNPLRPLLSLPDTTTTIRAPASNSSLGVQPSQFSMRYHQLAGGSSTTQSHLSLLRGINGSSQQHAMRGIDKWPVSVTSRQHPVRPLQQMSHQGLNERRPSRVVRGQQEMHPPPSVEEIQARTKEPSNVAPMPLIGRFGHRDASTIAEDEEDNEMLDLTLSLKTPYK